MQREDIVCGFEFGDGDEADLECRVLAGGFWGDWRDGWALLLCCLGGRR